MGKITLKYPDLNYLNPKIQVYLNGEEISEIKNGEEKNIELSSSGEIVFKSSFRKGILKVKKDCDYIISLQWGIFSGKLNPVIEDSSDEEILNESNNRRIKNNFSNGNILYIVLFIIAIIGISNSLGLFGSVSTENKMKSTVLYKYNIDDINYNEDKYKAYSIEYRGKVDDILTDIKNRFEFRDNGDCQYYGSYEDIWGHTALSVDSNCEYEIVNNKITIKIESLKQIYSPSNYAKNNGYYNQDISYEYDIVNEGELSETGKIMKMGKLDYHHVSYLHFLGLPADEILIDSKSGKQYLTDGTPAGNRSPEYIKNNSLNLSKCTIINSKDIK